MMEMIGIGDIVEFHEMSFMVVSINEAADVCALIGLDGIKITGVQMSETTHSKLSDAQQINVAVHILAQARDLAAGAAIEHDEALTAWKAANAELISDVAETKKDAETVDAAVRTIALRIASETDARKLHPRVNVSERSNPVVRASDPVLLQWLISGGHVEALKPNNSQVNALIKSGAAPAEIGGMEKKLIVNIDADLSDMVD